MDSLFVVCLVFRSRLRTYFKSKKLIWKKISHATDAGGATAGTIQIAFLTNKAWREIPKPPSSNLKDLVDITRIGAVVSLSEEEPTLLLDTSKWSDDLILPSVFSRTGWVSRKLILTELLICLDIPRQFDNQIIDYYGTELIGNSEFEEVVNAPVGKVIWYLAQTLLIREGEGDRNKLVPKVSIASPLYNSIIRGDFNPVYVQESSIEKSVKADDAEISVSLSNKKLFKDQEFHKPDKHNELLECLRQKFAMKWYCRYLFKSFRNYMIVKHGKSTTINR